MSRSLILVNYHSAALTGEAIRSARAASAEPLEVVVIDNSCDGLELAELSKLGDVTLIAAERNLGYAGGLNAGIAASSGDQLLLANPDLLFGAASIDLLFEALDEYAVTGPRFHWDQAGLFALPPAFRPGRWSKRGELWALRSEQVRLLRDRLRVRRRYAFWSARSRRRVDALSGAAMAMRRDVLKRHGGFDERFALYFEETDFFERLRRAGVPVGYEPAARCRHLYNQSAGRDSTRAARLYVESESRFFEKWYGRRFVAEYSRAAPEARAMPAALHSPNVHIADALGGNAVLEVSPLHDFVSAAGWIATKEEIRIPQEIFESLHGGQLFGRIADGRSGRVIETFAFNGQPA